MRTDYPRAAMRHDINGKKICTECIQNAQLVLWMGYDLVVCAETAVRFRVDHDTSGGVRALYFFVSSPGFSARVDHRNQHESQ